MMERLAFAAKILPICSLLMTQTSSYGTAGTQSFKVYLNTLRFTTQVNNKRIIEKNTKKTGNFQCNGGSYNTG